MSNIAVFTHTFEAVPNVSCAFTTRCGGTSANEFASANLSYEVGDEQDTVYHNRVTLQKQLGFVHWQELRQVHGDEIVFDGAPSGAAQKSLRAGDGLATTDKRNALMVKTADCQPLLLTHRSGNYIAALHVGWRGNVLGFPATGVKRFCLHYKLNPKDVFAVRGPSLGPIAAEFTNFAQEFPATYKSFFDPDTNTVDLWAMTRAQLLAAGVPDENIHGLDLCTKTLSDSFFSYRNARTTGRQAGLIWIN
ncbi:polyphenol oxidase family protein [Pseudodesulfovibrio senegalensis]|jgi:hypothetical protein|uniref:Laccase domain-containing protein n=1 Tax=Pseudodesulfovibrio senegalensis TaxID=1721087 RepID=A0A6N6N066_9BACT|nr:polyphenol oxidase family protein [Pseudodesulfovibrio senegalensis]KAB1437247.1 laccase domain-containing protein [Pseudodesulfovibrio senegalensis]